MGAYQSNFITHCKIINTNYHGKKCALAPEKPLFEALDQALSIKLIHIGETTTFVQGSQLCIGKLLQTLKFLQNVLCARTVLKLIIWNASLCTPECPAFFQGGLLGSPARYHSTSKNVNIINLSKPSPKFSKPYSSAPDLVWGGICRSLASCWWAGSWWAHPKLPRRAPPSVRPWSGRSRCRMTFAVPHGKPCHDIHLAWGGQLIWCCWCWAMLFYTSKVFESNLCIKKHQRNANIIQQLGLFTGRIWQDWRIWRWNTTMVTSNRPNCPGEKTAVRRCTPTSM